MSIDHWSFFSRYQRIKDRIESLALHYGRDPKEITTICVTKDAPEEVLWPLYLAGVRNFGESRSDPKVMERIRSHSTTVVWHFLGRLQSKMIPRIVTSFDYLHSLASVKMAQGLEETLLSSHQRMKVLLQVNCSGESSKQGFSKEELFLTWPILQQFSHLQIEGLMTMAPLGATPAEVRSIFAKTRAWKEEIESREKCSLPHLSMGMSGDYEAAIAEGATFLRIGRAIIG